MDQLLTGQVIAAFGRHMRVRLGSGAELSARPFGRALTVVCGDRVRCRLDARHEELHVLEVIERRHALYRSNLRGLSEPVVANLTHLMVVLAPLPVPDFFVIDRYLCAATSANIAPLLVLNKAELGADESVAAELGVYTALGYATLSCSAEADLGIEPLRGVLAPGSVAALVGQSGVGKSSLVRRLVPGVPIEIGELVRAEEGRHTTTAARLYDLPGGAALIDSPGVRDFAPAVDSLDERSLGFTEVELLAPGCRFADCRHMREPACAVQAGVESGQVHARRYESYRRLRRLHEDLSAARGPKRPR
jgi:ribosome biogenesis GTPase / thiamine phosphate phosphatase